MDPDYDSGASLIKRHESFPWYHGKISRANARFLLHHGGFLVREVIPFVSYELMTTETIFKIRRRVSDGLFQIIGLPARFRCLFSAVSHICSHGWAGRPCHRAPHYDFCLSR